MSETTAAPESPHAETVRTLATAMLRSALWPSAATVILATVLAGVLAGLPGALSAITGGAVAFASSLVTLGFMRWTAGFHPMFVMVVALGGYVGKMVILLIVMTLLRGVDAIDVMSLAATMLATLLVWAGAEVYGFRKTRVHTIVPSG